MPEQQVIVLRKLPGYDNFSEVEWIDYTGKESIKRAEIFIDNWWNRQASGTEWKIILRSTVDFEIDNYQKP